MRVNQLLWYARRARNMEPGELRARLGIAFNSAADYMHWRLHGRSAFAREFAVADHRFCGAAEPVLPELHWDFRADEAQVDAMLRGTHDALGFPWTWTPDPDAWHLAPDTGNLWPRKFSDTIDYRPGNAIGDARVMWEPNRLQQLVGLALLARYQPRRAAAATGLMRRQLTSWMSANPARVGINYVSAMECALRILSVCFASDLARPHARGDQRYWAAVSKLVLEHAAIVNARLSLHSSLGNHTVAEGTGLLLAALAFPEAPHAFAWEARALQALESAAAKVILPDGGAAEQALHYHAQVLDFLHIAVAVGRHFGREQPRLARLHRRGAEFLARFASTRAELPPIGDNDEGQALSRHLAPSWTEGPAASVAAAVAPISQHTAGGYTILRSANDGAELVFDHGPLGLAPNCAHGHADALAVTLRLGGRPLLIDPGTFQYGGGAAWRDHFRGTAAHNTVTVDGVTQARPAGPFLWATAYDCRLHFACTSGGRAATLIASHDGYRTRGVVHVRALRLVPGLLVVLDRIEGEGVHDCCLRWHFACPLEAGGEGFRPAGHSGVAIEISGGETCLVSGAETPPAGWQSPRYGLREPAWTIEAAAAAQAPHEFATVMTLRPGAGAAAQHVQDLRELVDSLEGEIRAQARVARR